MSYFDNPEARQIEAKAMAWSISIIITLNELLNKNTRSGLTTIILSWIMLGCFIFYYFKGGLFCFYEVLNVYSISAWIRYYTKAQVGATPTHLWKFISQNLSVNVEQVTIQEYSRTHVGRWPQCFQKWKKTKMQMENWRETTSLLSNI